MNSLCLILFTGTPGFWEFVSFIGEKEYRVMSGVCKVLLQRTNLRRCTAKFTGKHLGRSLRVVYRFPKLRTLMIDGSSGKPHHSQLSDIGGMTALKRLYLGSNQLTGLPDAIGQLTGLEELDLDLNEITKLPDSIGSLTALTNLHLAFNEITKLPDSIGEMTALTILHLHDNQLTGLPDAIGQLTGLEELDLSFNQLTALPGSIVALKNLTSLDLRYNPRFIRTAQSVAVQAWLQELEDNLTLVVSS